MKWLAAVFAIVLILASLIFILTGLQQLKEFVYDLDFDPQDDSQNSTTDQNTNGDSKATNNNDDKNAENDIEEIVDTQAESESDKGLSKVKEPDSERSTDDEGNQEELVQIRISFAGDCTIGTDENFTYVNSFPDRYEKVGRDDAYFFKGVKPVFDNDDLTLVNLETTFTTARKKADKKFNFKGDPSYVNILKEGSIEMVNISNNHIYDYLKQGFRDTIDTLEKAGIYYSGEGHIAYYESKGIIIASIGYNGWYTSIKESLKRDIKEAREKADLVIVSFHWGQERSNYPNSVQIELGRFSIDEGADIVVGHHPHVIQGIDKYKGKYIAYSLANFCFGGNRNPEDKDTFIFQGLFTFRNGELIKNEGIVYACSVSSVDYVNDYQPTLLTGSERERVISRILKYSTKLKYGISAEDVIFSE